MSTTPDIFKILGEINRKQIHYYEKLDQKSKKDIVPVVLMKWIAGTPIKRQVILVNEFVNPVIFELHRHPDLLWKLMTICTTGKNQTYRWYKAKSKNTKNNSFPMTIGIIKEYFHYSTREAEHSVKLIPAQYILAMAEELGKQSDEIDKIRKELGISKSRYNSMDYTEL